MTLAEVKKEALKIMFVNQDFVINQSTIEQLNADNNYSDYLQNMNGSINRCVKRLKGAGVLFYNKWTNLNDDSSDDLDLDTYFDEDYQELIPYWVKGELYQEDNYTIAITTKNEFEQRLAEILSNPLNNFYLEATPYEIRFNQLVEKYKTLGLDEKKAIEKAREIMGKTEITIDTDFRM